MVRDAQGQAVSLASQLPTLDEGVLMDEAKQASLPEPFRSGWPAASAEQFERRARVRA